MMKKLSISLLLTGAFFISTGFAPNTTLHAKNHVQHHTFHYVTGEKISDHSIETFITNCLKNLQINVDKQPVQDEIETTQPEKQETPTEEAPANEKQETEKEQQPQETNQEQTEEKNKNDNNNNEEEVVEQPEQTPDKETEVEETPVAEEPAEQEQEEEKEDVQPEEPAQEESTEEDTTEQANETEQTEEVDQPTTISEFEQQVVELTNEERQKHGLSDLQIDKELSKVARTKSEDMASRGYFSHNSPTYGSPFDMIQQSGINYRTAGENIAKGQRTPAQVVDAWMNSEGHRANILNENFTHIGVGYVEQGNIWTQQFIGK
ncbi:CAP domain-containing protein [Gracilibacillus sp. S3-1-1]|uniref:CAP domain-containing protein n=1 Tax=Gracilibacillus pellucidus TaxID=3095368 RepID=A0ACC6M6B9_9BACI|nr:CAP domain-containing protein [Gracilibacillus sp. S3-1-1]MDX8046428.1 CAP domain-containing protein [Gracilibacillus sp. S3-1-1]